jgi:hypothetical protein
VLKPGRWTIFIYSRTNWVHDQLYRSTSTFLFSWICCLRDVNNQNLPIYACTRGDQFRSERRVSKVLFDSQYKAVAPPPPPRHKEFLTLMNVPLRNQNEKSKQVAYMSFRQYHLLVIFLSIRKGRVPLLTKTRRLLRRSHWPENDDIRAVVQ